MWVTFFVASCHSKCQTVQRSLRERGLERETAFKWKHVPTGIFLKSFNNSASLTLYTRNINGNNNFYGKTTEYKIRFLSVKFLQKAITWWSCRIITDPSGLRTHHLMPRWRRPFHKAFDRKSCKCFPSSPPPSPGKTPMHCSILKKISFIKSFLAQLFSIYTALIDW